MHDAAAWMSAKGTPAWDVARIDRTFAETFVLRSELLGRGLPLAKAVLDRLLYQRDVMNHWTLVSKRFGPGI
jgi:anti-sigma regulatory factor (Ser/Thr protein kinase)